MSFWDEYGVDPTAIDTLLEKSDCTLEQLLDDEEVIQETKHLNEKLVQFLTRRDSQAKIMRYLVEPPAADADPISSAKYPFICSELYGCEIEPLTDGLMDNKEMLKKFFGFLDRDAPLPAAAATGWANVAKVLLKSRTRKFLDYVRENKLVPQFVKHTDSHCIVQLLMDMWGDHPDRPEQKGDEWFAEADVVRLLIEKLDCLENETDLRCKFAAEALCSTMKSPPLRALLEAKSTVDTLVAKLQNGPSVRFAVRVNTLKVLIAIVEDAAPREKPKHTADADTGGLGMGMLSGLGMARGDPTDFDEADIAKEMAAEKERLAKAAQENQQQAPADSAEKDDKKKDHTEEKAGTPDAVMHIASHLPVILKLATTAPQVDDAPTAFKWLGKTPLGQARLKAVELIAGLFRGNFTGVNSLLVQHKAIVVLLDLFFEYELNSFLHQFVLDAVVSCLRSPSAALRASLLSDGKLVQRILAADAENSKRIEAEDQCRMPQMAHITEMANALQLRTETVPAVAEACDSKEWKDFVAGSLEKENKNRGIVLGGEEARRPGGGNNFTSVFTNLGDMGLSGLAGALGGSSGGQQMGLAQMEQLTAELNRQLEQNDSSDDSDFDDDSPVEVPAAAAAKASSSSKKEEQEPENPFGDADVSFGDEDPFGDDDPFAELASGGAQTSPIKTQAESPVSSPPPSTAPAPASSSVVKDDFDADFDAAFDELSNR